MKRSVVGVPVVIGAAVAIGATLADEDKREQLKR